MARSFYLVQRMGYEPGRSTGPLGDNPFGYGRMGDYTLDYMGSAEFEWGAVPESFDRFKAAGKGLAIGEHEYNGFVLDFLWIEKNGEPFEDWEAWAEGRPVDEYSGKVYEERPFYGKERPYELANRLAGQAPPSYMNGEWRTAIYWALSENVMWAFKEDGHMERFLSSLKHKPIVRLRG